MIELWRVSKTYPPDRQALSDISLEIASGEFIFVAGPSGSGKTTLLRLLLGAETPTAGRISIDGQNIAHLSKRALARLRRKVGWVSQELKFLPDSSVLDNVALPSAVSGASYKESRSKAYHLLRELGLKERYDSLPSDLSAGERQRAAVARALVNNPALVLADEPTANLDSDGSGEIIRLLFKARARGATVVVATQNQEMIQRHGSRVILLGCGSIEEDFRLPASAEVWT